MTLQDRIAELEREYGNVMNAAVVLDIHGWILARAMTDPNYNPSGHLLAALGLRRVVSYERIESNDKG